MNVYDFDNTIYRGDSTVDFLFYCMKRYPAVSRRLPQIAGKGVSYLTGRTRLQAFKESLFSFLPLLPDYQTAVASFWDGHLRYIKPWYLHRQREDDVIISASPEFLLSPACEKLGVSSLLASPVDPRTGRFEGKNCHGEEKVRRFRAFFPRAEIEEFYSDSHNDDPMAKVSKKAFFVKGNRLLPWKK